jgi:CheY-like chemotaxis protein
MSLSELGHRTSGLRVLVVEDENLLALLVEDMLAELGHEVVGPVACLSTALEMAQRHDVDIAILDLNINGRDTYPVAAALAARGIPFVFATGYSRERLREPYRNVPMLQKPFQQDDLQKVFAETCRPKEA